MCIIVCRGCCVFIIVCVKIETDALYNVGSKPILVKLGGRRMCTVLAIVVFIIVCDDCDPRNGVLTTYCV